MPVTSQPGPATLVGDAHVAFNQSGPGRQWILGLLVLINGSVLYNAICHDPHIGYDAYEHFRYVEVLSTGRLPGMVESHEFFSPPLPYLLPAAARAAALSLNQAAKLAQLSQVLLSIGVTLLLLRICDRLRPGDNLFKLLALCLYGLPAVSYKTFSQLRGEPWVVFFSVLVLCEMLNILVHARFTWRPSLGLGLWGGCLLLSRQWGALLFAGVTLYGLIVAVRQPGRLWMLRTLVISSLLAGIIGGWFYFVLYIRHGSIRAFNRSPTTFSLQNQPLDFYVGAGNGKLFDEPIRRAFPNQVGPIFYSEFWGDYWCFFLVYARDPYTNAWIDGYHQEMALSQEHPPRWDTNRFSMGTYLGRVNLVALLPSLLFLLGVGFAASCLVRVLLSSSVDQRTSVCALLVVAILASFAGYGWFLVAYPNPGKGDTIKASYMIQALPCLALLGAEALYRLRSRSVWSFRVITGALLVAALHCAPTWWTRYGP
jgi:hypothetical protein